MENIYYVVIILFVLIVIFGCIDKVKPITDEEMENNNSRNTSLVFKTFLQNFKDKFSKRKPLNESKETFNSPYLGYDDYQSWGGRLIPDPASAHIPSELRFGCKNANYEEDDIGFESVCSIPTYNNNPYSVMARAIGYPRINKNSLA